MASCCCTFATVSSPDATFYGIAETFLPILHHFCFTFLAVCVIVASPSSTNDSEGTPMDVTLRLKPGLAERLREVRSIPSEEHQARLIGVDRSTLRRIDGGATPSGTFVAQFCSAFGLGL